MGLSYKDSQVSASEALRMASDESLDPVEAVRYTNVAEKMATHGLLVSSNARERWLAMSQAACAAGMRIIIETGFRSEPV